VLSRLGAFDVTEQTVLPKSPVGQALQYVLPHWEDLVRYCENGSLSIDNNLSERMVRPVAIGRKNYLFLGSDKAAPLRRFSKFEFRTFRRPAPRCFPGLG
jgi:hypothetical protein